MQYLYGDSTASSLTSNVLEFLRDAIDFSVFVLEADERIRAGRKRMNEVRAAADADIGELEAFGESVMSTIDSAPKRSGDSPAARCARIMTASCNDVVRSTVDAVREQLNRDIAQVDAEEAAERDSCLNALMTLLALHEPPGSSTVLRVALNPAGTRYEASWEGTCRPLELAWKFELGFPDGHLFSQAVRADRLIPSLELRAPELTGWIKKELKVRPHRIEHHTITEMTADGAKTIVRLRAEPKANVGFDIEVDEESNRISASRIVAASDPSAGAFDVADTDSPSLLELCKGARAAVGRLTRARLVEARIGDVDFRALDTFAEIVRRIVEHLAPIVHDIARHSLAPTELVLRKHLGGDRREEIFVSRAVLLEKYERLRPELRELFEPLALHTTLSRSLAPAGPSVVRSELPPSRPPPPLGTTASAVAGPPPPKVPAVPVTASSPPSPLEEVSDIPISENAESPEGD